MALKKSLCFKKFSKNFVLSALANKLELCKNQLKLLRQPSMYIFQEKNMQSLDLANGA